jgi:hypothetical protein
MQELLTTLPVEKLVSKDTSMVHEIRVGITLIWHYDKQMCLEFVWSHPLKLLCSEENGIRLNIANQVENFLVSSLITILSCLYMPMFSET